MLSFLRVTSKQTDPNIARQTRHIERTQSPQVVPVMETHIIKGQWLVMHSEYNLPSFVIAFPPSMRIERETRVDGYGVGIA